MKKYIVIASLLLSVAVPTAVFAQTSADIELQGQMMECLSLQNNLGYQSLDNFTNGEVSILQYFLQLQGYLNSEPTGYFGPLTFQATKDFQSDNGISPTGYVGPITRAKIASISDCGIYDNTTPDTTPILKTVPRTVKDPVITGVGSPANPANSFYPGDRVRIIGLNLPENALVYIGSTTVQAQSNASGYNTNFYAPNTLTPGIYNLYVVGNGTRSNIVQVTVMRMRGTITEDPIITMVRAKAADDFEAYVGENLYIEGTNLAGNYISTTKVYFGEVRATVKQAKSKLLKIVTPNLPSGTYDLTVSNEKGTSNPVKVVVHEILPVIPTISFVRAPTEDRNILHMNERAKVYGNNFNGTVYVKLVGKAQEYEVQAYKVSIGYADFIVPTVATTGEFDIYVEQSGVTSNSIKVQIVD